MKKAPLLAILVSTVLILVFGALRLSAIPTPPPPATPPLPIVGVLGATPAVIPVGKTTQVDFTVGMNDPSFIPGSLNLVRLTSAGTQGAIVGQLYDDGTHGDAVGGDQVYTLRVTLTEAALGQVQFQCSAAFKGFLKRFSTAPISIC